MRIVNHILNLSSYSSVEYIPTPIPSVPVDAGSYMALECGAKIKYAALGQHRAKVPQEVYNHLSFKANNFKGGYFSMQSEEKGTIIKVSMSFRPLIVCVSTWRIKAWLN